MFVTDISAQASVNKTRLCPSEERIKHSLCRQTILLPPKFCFERSVLQHVTAPSFLFLALVSYDPTQDKLHYIAAKRQQIHVLSRQKDYTLRPKSGPIDAKSVASRMDAQR